MEPCEEMVRAWAAFQRAEDDENLFLKIETRRRLNELAQEIVHRILRERGGDVIT